MTPVLRAYLLAMAAPAVVLTAMLLVGPSAAPGDPVLLVVLLLLGAVASNFPVIVSPRLKTDAAPAVYLAAVLLFTPVTAVALIGGSRLLGEGVLCFRRNPATGFYDAYSTEPFCVWEITGSYDTPAECAMALNKANQLAKQDCPACSAIAVCIATNDPRLKRGP